jgi:type I restriction enzyme M protein
MKEQRVQELPPLQLKPIISYPRVAEAGRQYLLSIDVQLTDGSPWPYQEEEFEISFVLETAPFFTHEPLGEQEPGIVLHRFGSTYGAAEYLLTASQLSVAPGTIKIALLNGWGLPIAQLKLDCEVKHEVIGKKQPKVSIYEELEFADMFSSPSDLFDFKLPETIDFKPPERPPIDFASIRSQIEQAGWLVQDLVDADLSSRQGVAIEHHPYFRDDYLLFVDQQFVGIVYTYPIDDLLTDIEEDVVDLKSIEGAIESWTKTPVKHTRYRKLPFIYNTSSIETRFTNALEVEPYTRSVFTFHRPETLATWLKQAPDSSRHNDLFRSRLHNMPPLEQGSLLTHQFEALQHIEQSLQNNRPRTLVEMETGMGKTHISVYYIYRLLTYANAKRILYIADPPTTKQYIFDSLQRFAAPDGPQLFTEMYQVRMIADDKLDPSVHVYVGTMRDLYRLYSSGREGKSLPVPGHMKPGEIVQKKYCADLPIEYFDVIVLSECEQLDFQLWQPVLDYFDALFIGVADTLTDSMREFFNQNVVYSATSTDEERQEEIEASTQRQKQIESTLRTARDLLQTDEGLSYESDRLSLLVWLLFLKNLDDFEQAQQEVMGKDYQPIIEEEYRWRDWVVGDFPPHHRKGDELLKFVNDDLIPYLSRLNGSDARDIRSITGTIFRNTTNPIRSGYILRGVVDKLATINFNSSDDIHSVSLFYETMLKEMRDSAGDAGEFYTPRPVVRFIIDRLQPKLGESLLDPACGTGGFLVETFGRLASKVRTAEQRRQVQNHLIGIEKKPIPYSLAIMNMLLHGIEAPNIIQENALTIDILQSQDEDHIDIIATTPPFVSSDEEPDAIYPLPEGEHRHATPAPLLFMHYIMQTLRRPGGRCGVVVPNGFLFWDEVAITIRRRLLTRFHLHTIVRLPAGVFSPYTSIPSNILFFEAGHKQFYSESEPCTKEAWFYEIPAPPGRRSYSKTRPIQYEAFQPCIDWWDNRVENEHAWKVPIEQIFANDCNLDYHNPHHSQ